MNDEPFGRQSKSLSVIICDGEPADIEFWYRRLKAAAEYKGDSTQELSGPIPASGRAFRIYPRAMND